MSAAGSSESLISKYFSIASSGLLICPGLVTPYCDDLLSGPSVNSPCPAGGERTGRGSGMALSGRDRKLISLLLRDLSGLLSVGDSSGGEVGADIGSAGSIEILFGAAFLDERFGGVGRRGSWNVGLGSR